MEIGISWQNQCSYATAGSTALVMSAADFKEKYLWGIPTVDKLTGKEPDNAFFEEKLLASQAEVENYLDLKLFPQPVTETKDFIAEEFRNFGYIKTTYVINRITTLKGRLNEQQLIAYPQEWLNIKRTSDGKSSRNLNIVPNGAASVTMNYYAITYPNYFPFGFARIPNYWQVQYITGMDRIPADIADFIALYTTAKVLPIIELSVLGGSHNSFGMASQNLSIDGLSQGGSKMNGGNIFQQRLKNVADQIAAILPRLRYNHVGITFDVC